MEGPHSRWADPRTSRAAAKALRPKRLTIRAKVLAFAEAREDFIDEDVVREFGGGPESSYRKRRSELTDEGWIVDSGRERRNSHGNQEVVWVHRFKLADPPPLRLKTKSARASSKESKAEALRHANNLEQFAKTMRGEGRGPFADALLDTAAFIRSVTA